MGDIQKNPIQGKTQTHYAHNVHVDNATDDPVPVEVQSPISGTFQDLPPNDFKITTQLITNTVVKAPATPDPNRVGVQIDNYDPSNTVYYNRDTSLTADLVVGTTSGGQIGGNASQNFGLSGGKDVYVRTEAGKTAIVQIIEWIRNP